MSGYKGLLELRTPFIALTQYHFIVVYRVTEKGVFAGDPAGGLVTIPVEKFEKQWSKNALLLKPTEAFLSYPETQASWKKYGLIFDGFRSNILELFLGTLLLFIFGVMAPLFIQFIFDGVLTSKDPTVLIALFGSMVLINTLSTMTTWARGMIMNNVAAQIDGKFSALFLGHTLHLPLNFFSVRRVGDITTRLSEVAKIRDFVTNKTLTLATNVLSVFAYGLVLSLFNYKLILVVGVLLPILVLFISKAVPKMNKINLSIYKIEAKLKSSTYEIFHGLETIKSLAGTIAARWRWEAGFIEYMTCNFRTNRISRTIAGASEFFKNLITVSVLLTAVYLYIENKLSLGQVVAVNMIIGSLLRPAIAIASDTRSISMIGLSLSRVDDLITAAVEPDVRGGQYTEMKVQGGIEFRGVTFQYGSELSPVVLDGVSLKIEPGQTVAFVGPSGSGKTTLSLMVNLLYFPTKGQILIDGIDATLIPLRTLRRQVAMIMQENGLFSGSVLDNIALGDPQPSFARAMNAARLADAHDFIGKLSEGYSTNLGESGVGLSGGQRQRINIARALYLDPPILIMDEATSALDALSEQAIVKNIKERQQKRTTVIIAHRLNTVMHADKIYVMSAGKLVESGSHAELLAAQGFYFDLFRKQINM
jgi:ATP-binding cassette subfamily B protein